MAKRRKRKRASTRQSGQISSERCARFYRLLQLLRAGPRSREEIARRLRLDMRGFYRDLKMLRELRVRITSKGHRYQLAHSFERAISRLPFPDPRLNLHEALLLAKGRGPAHRKLQRQIRKIVGRG